MTLKNMYLKTILKKIDNFIFPPLPRPIIIMDWFNERQSLPSPTMTIKPKRANSGPHFDGAIPKLIEGEIIVNMTERRVFQKLDGKLVEWVRQEIQ